MTQRQKQHIEAAKALAEFANAAAKFDIAWDDDGFRELTQHYPFDQSFGLATQQIIEWSKRTAEDSKKYSTFKISEQVLNKIASLMPRSKFEVSSWNNDLCPSVYEEASGIQIFCPNCEVTDEDKELYSTFSFTQNTDDVSYNHDQSYETIEECIQAVEEYRNSISQEKKDVLNMITEDSQHLIESNKVDTRTMLKAIAARCEHLITTDF